MSLLIKLALILALLSAFLLAFEVSVNADKIDVQREQLLTLSNAINDFSLDLFKKGAKIFSGNIIMSPLSADIALALLSMGTEGRTQAEINTALRLPNAEFTKSAFASLIDSLNSTKDITLNIANKVYVINGIPLSPQFKTLATDVFGSEVESINFAKSKEAAQTMNSWIEEKTNHMIKDFISPSSLDGLTRVFLLNAIYFKANWQHKFDEYDTYNRDFHLTRTSKKEVKMMTKFEKLQYYDNTEWGAKIVEIPYKNGDFSMVIILPNKIDGLSTVINKIGSGADLTSAFKRLEEKYVNIHLPRFKIEKQIDLMGLLKLLGIQKLFDTGAELGGLLQSGDSLYVSEAMHKALIEVGEKGTIAVAVTGFKASATSAIIRLRQPTYVYVDHPFLFCIKTRDNIPIFIGQYTGE